MLITMALPTCEEGATRSWLAIEIDYFGGFQYLQLTSSWSEPVSSISDPGPRRNIAKGVRRRTLRTIFNG
jgi:hypothetical protein